VRAPILRTLSYGYLEIGGGENRTRINGLRGKATLYVQVGLWGEYRRTMGK